MLVAVVVLHEENTKKWANSNGFLCSFSELCPLEQLRHYVLSELTSTAERNKVLHFLKTTKTSPLLRCRISTMNMKTLDHISFISLRKINKYSLLIFLLECLESVIGRFE